MSWTLIYAYFDRIMSEIEHEIVDQPRAWTLAVLALVVAVASAGWGGVAVHPRARRLRAALRSPAASEEIRDDFARAHRAAVALNLVAMLAAATSLGAATTALRQ